MPAVPLAPTAAELYAIAKSSLPKFLFAKPGVREYLWGAAELFVRTGQQIDYWWAQTKIGQSDGIWLDGHLADRGSSRRAGESDDVGRERARKIEDAATLDFLEALANAMLAADGFPAVAKIAELRQGGLHAGRGYANRGYRTTQEQPSRIVVILPFGTHPETAAAIGEAIRKRRAAGFPHTVEVRRIP